MKLPKQVTYTVLVVSVQAVSARKLKRRLHRVVVQSRDDADYAAANAALALLRNNWFISAQPVFVLRGDVQSQAAHSMAVEQAREGITYDLLGVPEEYSAERVEID